MLRRLSQVCILKSLTRLTEAAVGLATDVVVGLLDADTLHARVGGAGAARDGELAARAGPTVRASAVEHCRPAHGFHGHAGPAVQARRVGARVLFTPLAGKACAGNFKLIAMYMRVNERYN